jgi:hypothetical protein
MFETSSTTYAFHDSKTNNSRRVRDEDPTDGNGSLTYSAASSVNSGTGESTDSSFADVLRGLDVQESKEIAAYLEQRLSRREDRSVAESFAYSANVDSLAYSTEADTHGRSIATDGETKLHGTDYLGSITGHSQFSEAKYADDTTERQDSDVPISSPDGDDDILFAPAEHFDSVKRRKKEKRAARKAQNATLTPPSTNSSLRPVPVSAESRQGTPPTSRPPKREEIHKATEEEHVWYAKWWMLCFPDMNQMTPKR